MGEQPIVVILPECWGSFRPFDGQYWTLAAFHPLLDNKVYFASGQNEFKSTKPSRFLCRVCNEILT